LIFAGQPAKAIEVLKSQMVRDPFYPVQALSFLGYAFFIARRYDEALPPLREAIHRAPNFRPPHLFLAATLSRLGRTEEARAEAAHVLRLDPGFTISGTPKLTAPFKHERDFRHFTDSLRAAGLPD
jgi:adenylate cyclase